MSLHESDGISEVFDDALRLGLTAAGRVAETRIRRREQQLRDAAAHSDQAKEETLARIQAERAAARAELAPVYRDQWWDQAQPADIQRAWETASQWRDLDPEAARAGEQIRGELRDRYEIDVDNLNSAAGGQPIAEGVLHTEPERVQTRREQTQAAAVNQLAARLDAAQLTAAGVAPDAIEARDLGEISQAYPPEQAVADSPSGPPKPRARGAQTSRAIKRQERGR